MSSDRLLDAHEVAELLHVPVGWVREHTRSNAIPHLRLGRYVRYDRSRVLEWLADCEQGGGHRLRKRVPRVRS